MGRAGRVVTGVDWTPQDVHFAHAAPPDTSEHVRFFGAHVHFGMRANALVLLRWGRSITSRSVASRDGPGGHF